MLPSRPTPESTRARIRRIVGTARVAVLASALLTRAAIGAPPANRLTAVVSILPVAGSARLRVPLVLEVEGARGTLRVVVRAPDGSIAASIAEDLTAAPAAPGLRIFGALDLDPGSYSLEIEHVLSTPGEVLRSTLDLELPEPGNVPWIASPILPVADDAFLSFRATQGPVLERPFPFVTPRGDPFLPSSTLALGSNAAPALMLLVYAPGGQLPFLEGRWVAEQNGEVFTSPIALLGMARTAYPDVFTVEIEVAPPPDRAGAHRLSVGFVGGGTAEPRTELAVILRPGAPREPTAQEPPRPSFEPLDPDLAAAFRRVLSHLGRGEVEIAVETLDRLEEAALHRRTPRQLDDLRAAERSVLGPILSSRPEAAPAALDLLARLDERYQEAGDPWRAAVNRLFVREIVGGLPPLQVEDQTLPADLLALLDPPAALEIDPAHPLALLRTAIHLEKGSRHAEAVHALRTLLSAQPANTHARLRLGICLRSLGRDDDSAAELRTVLSSEGPEWVLELAAQELGELERGRDRSEAAEQALRRGLELGGGQQLMLQLAFLLEDTGRPDEAISLVNRLPIEAGESRVSPRRRYGEDAPEEAALFRERVHRRGTESWPALAAALGGGR